VEVTEYGYGMTEEETDKNWQHLVLTGCSNQSYGCSVSNVISTD